VHERARAIAAGELEPAQARDAATVVLVRDAAAGPEVFLLRRVRTMAFGAGMHVFPGGKVEPTDDGGESLPAAWADALTYGDRDLLRRVVGAAVRETAEECGVILDPADLRPFAHWVTPLPEPRRYDTRFLLAALPAGQVAAVSDGEADEGLWVPAAHAADRTMMPPTRVVCAELATFPDVATALSAERTIARIAPVLRPDGDSWRLDMEIG
jgi:8-oxo-dGTP pyrophosphatase MutT (NUDIX family)